MFAPRRQTAHREPCDSRGVYAHSLTACRGSDGSALVDEVDVVEVTSNTEHLRRRLIASSLERAVESLLASAATAAASQALSPCPSSPARAVLSATSTRRWACEHEAAEQIAPTTTVRMPPEGTQ